MKKQMAMLLAVAAMAGCAKNEVVENPIGGDSPIKVKTFVNKSSKATSITNAGFDAFQMVAYKTAEANTFPTGVNTTPFISTVDVDKTENTWAYVGQPKYWPAGQKLSFFAYAPKEAVTLSVPSEITWPNFDYTVKAEASQEDLIVASGIDQTATSNGGSVALNFNHLLSQILFTVTPEAGFTMEVSSIQITGVNSKNTYTFTSDGGAWSGTPSTLANYIYTSAEKTGIAATTALDGPGSSKSLMLVPQTLPAEAKLSVKYKATASDGSGVTFDDTKTVTLAGTWVAGKKYTYALTLSSGATPINVVPSVNDDWTAGTVTPPTM